MLYFYLAIALFALVSAFLNAIVGNIPLVFYWMFTAGIALWFSPRGTRAEEE